MSAEQKKFLWISLSVCAFVLALAATGFILFAPKKGGATAPATVGNVAAPKSADPQDFLISPPLAPSFEQPRSAAGDVVIVYGEKPESLDGTGSITPTAGQTIPAQAETIPSAEPIPAPAPAPKTATKLAPKALSRDSAAPAKVQAPKKMKADEYWIQAASFASRGRADELKDSLAAKGIASCISVKDIDGKSWYRVRIGPYTGKAEAEGWLTRLRALPGCAEAYISKTVVERNG